MRPQAVGVGTDLAEHVNVAESHDEEWDEVAGDAQE